MGNTHTHPGGGAPANDTEVPANLPIGGTYETNAWRVHRYSDSARFTHIVNAGVRGKKCMEISIRTSYGQDLDLLDLLVAGLLQCAALDPEPATLAALAFDAPLLSPVLETTVSHLRGVDVETGAIRIDSEWVNGYFSMTEFRLTVTALIEAKNGAFKQDSHLYNADRRSLPKAYRWARENAAKIGSMTRNEIYNGLREAGVRVSTWG